MTTLTLDATGEGCTVALVHGGTLLAEATHPGFAGSAASLPALVETLLAPHPAPTEIAVVVGPGSFTGIRAALAFAGGYALAAAIPLRGTTVGDALRTRLGPLPHPVWIASDSRRARIHLDRDGHLATLALADLPAPPPGLVIAGSAAPAAAAHLGLTPSPHRHPNPQDIAAAAAAHPRPAIPLYIDPVEARPNPPPRPAPFS